MTKDVRGIGHLAQNFFLKLNSKPDQCPSILASGDKALINIISKHANFPGLPRDDSTLFLIFNPYPPIFLL